jgi:predicted RND superfamily exporter protein
VVAAPSKSTLAERVVDLVARGRWLTVCLILAAAVAPWAAWRFGPHYDPTRPPVDNSLRVWFLEGDETLVRQERFERMFGNDEAVLVGWSEDGGVFSPAALDLVADVSSRMAASSLVEGVTSLSTVLEAESRRRADGQDELVVERLYRAPVTPEVAAAVERRVLGDPLYAEHLVSPDRKVSILSVQPKRGRDRDEVRAPLLAHVRAAVDAAFVAAGRDPKSWHWAGGGVVNDALNLATQRDSAVFSGVSLLVVAGCLLFALRRVSAVLLALASVGLATVMLVGTYLACGQTVNMVTTVLPSLVLVIGITDSVYFLTTWFQERDGLLAAGLDRRAAIARVIGHAALPGLVNSITSAVGFWAFASAKMAVIRQLGLFAGLGIALAYACSLVIVTVGLELLDPVPPTAGVSASGPRADAALTALSRWVTRHWRKVLWGCVVAVVVSVAGILRLRVDSDPVRYFYPDHPIRRDTAFFEERFGPHLPLELVVDTGVQDGVLDPELLRAIEHLGRTVVDEEPLVGSAASIAQVARRLHRALGDEDALPPSREALEQELLWYDPQRSDDPLQLVDVPGWRVARITMRIPAVGTREGKELMERIQVRARELLPRGVTLEAGGYAPLYVRLCDYLVWGQVSSLATTFLVVSGVLFLLFRSARYALIALPSNVIPVLGVLGFMGWVGIDLDIATVLIASIALGVAVDDTVHFVFRFREEVEGGLDTEQALEKTLRTTGAAISATSFVITLGFGVVSLASLKSVAMFGLLTSVTMLVALGCELLITPSVILALAPRAVRPGPGPKDPAVP